MFVHARFDECTFDESHYRLGAFIRRSDVYWLCAGVRTGVDLCLIMGRFISWPTRGQFFSLWLLLWPEMRAKLLSPLPFVRRIEIHMLVVDDILGRKSDFYKFSATLRNSSPPQYFKFFQMERTSVLILMWWSRDWAGCSQHGLWNIQYQWQLAWAWVNERVLICFLVPIRFLPLSDEFQYNEIDCGVS